MKTKMMSLTLTLAATLCLALASPAAEPRKKSTPESKPAVTDIRYFPQSSVLRVELASGRTFHYEDVPEALADQFAVAEQKREFLDREIAGHYRSATAKETEQAATPAAGKAKSAAKPKAPATAKPPAKKAPAEPTAMPSPAKAKASTSTRKAPESSEKAAPKTPVPPR